MASFIMLAANVLVLYALTFAEGYRLAFPRYSFRAHPIYRHKQFRDQNFRPAPVVMRRYIKHNSLGFTDAKGMMFTVGTAKYVNHRDGTSLGDPLDALYTPMVAGVTPRKQLYLEVEINLNARVFLAMVTRRMDYEDLSYVKKVSGLESRWSNLRGIEAKDGKPIQIGSRSRGTSYELPAKAVIVESYFSRNTTIRLPTPRLFKVNGEDEVTQYFLFFAQPAGPHRAAVAFTYPESPQYITDLANGRRMRASPAVPNEQCPSWLHCLYRTKSRDPEVAKETKELPYWRTWHPMVDALYWCYFDHEHGSYPGKYKPLLDYTAWKTPDNTTSHGRQNESDEGFKVISIPLHKQRKFVVITVHMHCSKPRRFHARHHTMIFAVLDENWKLEMELHMKMDFGFGLVTTNSFHFVTMNKEQEKIKRELGIPVKRFRRFNVINLDNYPKNIDMRYRTRTGAKPTMKNKDLIAFGIYEKWAGPLNTCQSSNKGPLDQFEFDFRDVATGKKRMYDPDNAPMTRLNGDSVDRQFMISKMGDVLVGTEFCRFNGTKKPIGVFYTDPYFGSTFASHGENRLRQYIRRGFQTIVFRRGEYSAVDPWAGHYELSPNHVVNRRCHSNIEWAVKADRN